MDDTDESQTQDPSPTTAQVAEGSVMEDMVVSGLVKPTEFKSRSGQKLKSLLDDERSKMLAMVKGLDKYKENENIESEKEKSPVPKKTGDSLHTATGKISGGSLSEYVDSELACLHETDKHHADGIGKSERKEHKPVPHVASVSAEQQMQFESLLKGDSATPAINEQDTRLFKSKDDLSEVSQVATEKNDVQEISQKSAREKEPKLCTESPKKKKDKLEGKGSGKKNVGNNSDGPGLGSYSQLLISMGRRSPNRKIEVVHKSADMVSVSPEAEYQSTGKKKRNRKKKGNQQSDTLSPPNNEAQPVILSSSDRPQSAGKKKKDKSPNLPKEKDVMATVDRTQNLMSDRFTHKSTDSYVEMSKKQKKKLQQSGSEIAGNSELMGRKQKNNEQGHSSIKAGRLNQHVSEVKNEDAFVEVSVSIPKADHMYVIGPQGKHLQEIMTFTGVAVSVPKLNSKSEEIVLRGDRMQIGPAMSMMFSMCEEAKMDSRPNRQGQSQNQRVMGQGQPRQQKQRHGQGYGASDLSHEMERNLNISDSQNGGRRKNEMCVGQVVKQPNQQGSWQAMGQPGSQQGHGQRRQGNGQGQYDRPITPRGEMDQGMSKGQGKRQRKKKVVFSDYISNGELAEGLKNGSIIQGSLRINPRNYEESYVPHPDGKSDILISGMKARNRALNGDIVAVHILDEGEWKIHNNELAVIGNATEDSDPEVVIEGEEIVEMIGDKSKVSTKSELVQKGSTGSNTSPEQGKGQREQKGACHSPNKRFTTLNEMMSDQSPVKKTLMTDSGMDKVKKLLQRTGVVVSVIEKKSSMTCAGHIKLMQDRNPNRALFHPNDHRMPRVIIPMGDCPKDFPQRPVDYANTLYVCRITEWRQDNFFSEGRLVKCLGEAGEIEPETEGMLYENEVDFSEFPDKALQCLPSTPWSIPATELDYRRDFRSACVFTIDPATARDLDDALSCEDLGDGRYKVGVHIADVSYFVTESTDLDEVASCRSTSVYLVDRVIPMLPRLLCEQLCSLNPDEDRMTFSVEWTINEMGEVEDEWFGRSVIRSCVKLAYDHAQGFIEEPERDWTKEELPAISEKFTVSDIKTRVLTLHKIAVQLRKGRMEGGALRLDQIKLQYSLDPDSGLPNGYSVYHQKDSNRLVEEFMLLANMAVAHKINRHFPDRSILRRHPPPQEKMVENLKEQCSALGIHLDVSGAHALQVSLRNYSGDDDNSLARMQVLVALCAKPMQNAVYFCTGCIDDESLYHHYALNVPLYTHFTSPIRRYPDIMVHRLLGAALEYSEKPSRSAGELEKIAKHCNDKKTAAKRVGDLSSDLFFSIFVKTVGPLEERAMVMGVLDKAFDIFVLKLGVSKRVYCDKLPIKEKVFKQDMKVPSLTLVWDSVDGEPEFRQEITIFSMVDCVLDKGDQPLQWTAVIKRPRPVIL